jgi:hypothetical protein
VNDLPFGIAIGGCEGKGLGSDNIRFAVGEQKELTPGSACWVYGPTSRIGPWGMISDSGSYIGCLLLPEERNKKLITLRASEVRMDVSLTVCDKSVERPASN